MLKPKSKALIALVGASALILSAGCNSTNGGDENGGNDQDGNGTDSDFESVSDEIESWDDICETFDINEAAEPLSIDGFRSGPDHVGLGSAVNPDSISCEGQYYFDRDDTDVPFSGDITISALPGDSIENTEDFYDQRLTLWHEDIIESQPDNTLVLDESIEGDWNDGHAYAMSTFSAFNEVLVIVNAGSYLVEAHVTVPYDPGYRQAVEQGLEGDEADQNRTFDFTFNEYASFIAEDYIVTAYESLDSQL